MCGRFALYTPPARLARYFEATLAAGVDPAGRASYNVAPTDTVLGLRRTDAAPPGRELAGFRWGLGGGRAPGARGGARFNARAETLASRPSFRDAYAHRRLVVPADGFYEWRKVGGSREPHYIHRADGAPLAFAGLWEDGVPGGVGPAGPEVAGSCTVVTTAAGPDVEPLHDRMPVVLEPEAIDVWLCPDVDREELAALLRPAPAGTLLHHPVDPRVGSVAVDEPGLIAPRRPPPPGTGAAARGAAPGAEQLSLLEDHNGRGGSGHGGGRR